VLADSLRHRRTAQVFMRITVMAMETVMLFPTIVKFFIFYHKTRPWAVRIYFGCVALHMPALLLVDHGHFQVWACRHARGR
jgi:hypothetical protein